MVCVRRKRCRRGRRSDAPHRSLVWSTKHLAARFSSGVVRVAALSLSSTWTLPVSMHTKVSQALGLVVSDVQNSGPSVSETDAAIDESSN